jgi:hypothetical protein
VSSIRDIWRQLTPGTRLIDATRVPEVPSDFDRFFRKFSPVTTGVAFQQAFEIFLGTGASARDNSIDIYEVNTTLANLLDAIRE